MRETESKRGLIVSYSTMLLLIHLINMTFSRSEMFLPFVFHSNKSRFCLLKPRFDFYGHVPLTVNNCSYIFYFLLVLYVVLARIFRIHRSPYDNSIVTLIGWNGAKTWELGLTVHMGCHVIFQMIRPSEGFTAVHAKKGPDARVNFHVLPKSPWAGKGFATCWAS